MLLLTMSSMHSVVLFLTQQETFTCFDNKLSRCLAKMLFHIHFDVLGTVIGMKVRKKSAQRCCYAFVLIWHNTRIHPLAFQFKQGLLQTWYSCIELGIHKIPSFKAFVTKGNTKCVNINLISTCQTRVGVETTFVDSFQMCCIQGKDGSLQ